MEAHRRGACIAYFHHLFFTHGNTCYYKNRPYPEACAVTAADRRYCIAAHAILVFILFITLDINNMNTTFLDELDNLRIPTFEFSWPEACSADVESIEQDMNQWARSHHLIVNDRYQARVDRTKYGWLAARCYPNANRQLLQIFADYFIWFFLADDLFVDRVDIIGPETIPNLTAMIDILDFNQLGPEPVYGEAAWLDVCRRLRAQLSAEHFQRFANGMRMWASTAALQILNHTRSASVGIRQYETIRRHTSGMNPCLDLADIANDGAVTPAIFYRDDVQQLRRHANNVVCWSNDIQSLAIEIRQPGQQRNMVVVYAEQGHSLQEGIEYAAARVRLEISQFEHLARTTEAHAGRELRGFITGMKHWMRGYQDWVESDTERYKQRHARQDADDRGLLSAG